MTVLILTVTLLTIILILRMACRKDMSCGINFLTGIGILIGLFVLGFDRLAASSFGASTPVLAETENLTDEELKVYAIVFWSHSSAEGHYVIYDGKLKPGEKSSFWFENDSGKAFWLAAKDKEGEIVYLETLEGTDHAYNFRIRESAASEMPLKEEVTGIIKSEDRFLFFKGVLLGTVGSLTVLLIYDVIRHGFLSIVRRRKKSRQ